MGDILEFRLGGDNGHLNQVYQHRGFDFLGYIGKIRLENERVSGICKIAKHKGGKSDYDFRTEVWMVKPDTGLLILDRGQPVTLSNDDETYVSGLINYAGKAGIILSPAIISHVFDDMVDTLKQQYSYIDKVWNNYGDMK